MTTVIHKSIGKSAEPISSAAANESYFQPVPASGADCKTTNDRHENVTVLRRQKPGRTISDLLHYLRRVWRQLIERHRRRRAEGLAALELSSMSDHMLRDIGIERDQLGFLSRGQAVHTLPGPELLSASTVVPLHPQTPQPYTGVRTDRAA